MRNAELALTIKKIELANIIAKIPKALLADDSIMHEMNGIYKDITGSQAAMNKACAEFHGITVSELVSSPNMEVLVNKHAMSVMEGLAKFLVSKGFTDEQARALLAYCMLENNK